MRITKRVSFILITILFGYISVYSQTRADVKMGEILNNGDLFQIREQYPILKDSVSIKMLNLVSEAQLGIGFNQLERAGVALDSLLQFHQAELGAETSIGMAALQGMNFLNLGMYEQAGKVGEGLVNALKNSVPFEALYNFVFIEKIGKALANVPKPYLERPDWDITVPSIVETVEKLYFRYRLFIWQFRFRKVCGRSWFKGLGRFNSCIGYGNRLCKACYGRFVENRRTGIS